MNLARRLSLALAVVSIPWSAAVALAPGTPARGEELRFVVIVTRHGVRPPTVSNDQINPYSAEPWPQWDVPPGYLTAHGRALMKLFGAYDRAQFARAGLFSPSGCADANRVYFWADTDERTIETGHALVEGMLPGCTVEVHSAPIARPWKPCSRCSPRASRSNSLCWSCRCRLVRARAACRYCVDRLPPPLRWLRIFSLSTPTGWKATISVGAASPSLTCGR